MSEQLGGKRPGAMPLQRYLSEPHLERMERDFEFLVESVRETNGELVVELRANGFNLYCHGNSLAYVDFRKTDAYRVRIRAKFCEGFQDDRFIGRPEKNDVFFEVPRRHLRAFFQQKHLDRFASNIAKVNYSEELLFEQSVVADNRDRDDLVIIDRQIEDRGVRLRMDLLGLTRCAPGRYRFLVLEAKTGKNSELDGKVAEQVAAYVDRIESQFDDYQKCYERNFVQKRRLGLITRPSLDAMEIVRPVGALVVVFGYSGQAQSRIENLKRTHPAIRVRLFDFQLRAVDIAE